MQESGEIRKIRAFPTVGGFTPLHQPCCLTPGYVNLSRHRIQSPKDDFSEGTIKKSMETFLFTSMNISAYTRIFSENFYTY